MRRGNAFVLFYHRILPVDSQISVRMDVFEAQIRFLKDAGYVFLDARTLADFFAGKLEPSGKYVLLTFDDGWADNLFFVTPILKKYSIRALLAVCISLINPSEEKRTFSSFEFYDGKDALYSAVDKKDMSQFLSWNELREMKDSGAWDFASHGVSHLASYSSFLKIRGFYPKQDHWTMKFALGGQLFEGAPRAEFRSILADPITEISDEFKTLLKKARNDAERLNICSTFKNPIRIIESQDEFRKRVHAELLDSKLAIKENLDLDTDCLVWPWGHYSEISEQLAKECGYKMLFTTDRGHLTSKTSAFRIPRLVAPKNLLQFRRRISNGIFSFLGF